MDRNHLLAYTVCRTLNVLQANECSCSGKCLRNLSRVQLNVLKLLISKLLISIILNLVELDNTWCLYPNDKYIKISL
jgi:hypothetical protein